MIELMAVLVSVGVLAAIALPSLFTQIERHRAQEAINTLGAIRNAMESCGVSQAAPYDFTNCGSFSAINMTDPSYNASTNPGANFTYAISGNDNGTYTVTATRANPSIPANTVTITRSSSAQVTCTGGGAYLGFC